jgi:hypothetical protein
MKSVTVKVSDAERVTNTLNKYDKITARHTPATIIVGAMGIRNASPKTRTAVTLSLTSAGLTSPNPNNPPMNLHIKLPLYSLAAKPAMPLSGCRRRASRNGRKTKPVRRPNKPFSNISPVLKSVKRIFFSKLPFQKNRAAAANRPANPRIRLHR